MEEGPQFSRERLPGREHIPLYPKTFIIWRVVQLVLALAATCLTAYGLKALTNGPECIMLFTAGAASISCTYCIVSERWAPSIYNYWAVMGLDMFLVVLWPVSFSLLGNHVSTYLGGYRFCSYYVGCYIRGLSRAEKLCAYCLGAAAIIGIVELFIFIISLSIHGTMVYRHRAAGLHCTPGSTSPSTSQPTFAGVTAAPQAVVVPANEKPTSVNAVSSDEPPLPVYTQAAVNKAQEVYVPQHMPQDARTPPATAVPTNDPQKPFNFSQPTSRPASQRSVRSAYSAQSTRTAKTVRSVRARRVMA